MLDYMLIRYMPVVTSIDYITCMNVLNTIAYPSFNPHKNVS